MAPRSCSTTFTPVRCTAKPSFASKPPSWPWHWRLSGGTGGRRGRRRDLPQSNHLTASQHVTLHGLGQRGIRGGRVRRNRPVQGEDLEVIAVFRAGGRPRAHIRLVDPANVGAVLGTGGRRGHPRVERGRCRWNV